MKAFQLNKIQAEQALLGSLLHDNTTLDDIADLIQADDFSSQFHGETYAIIRNLLSEGKSADIICVSQHLKARHSEQHDEYFIRLSEISRGVFSTKNIKHYADIVKKASIDRKMLAAANDIVGSINQQKENRLDYAQQRFSDIANQVPCDIVSAADVLRNVLQAIDERHINKTELTGLATGFPALDKITNGLHNGDLIILAARPSMGKTMLALNIVEHISVTKQLPVLFFSLEMSGEQLLERLLISTSDVNADYVRTGNLNNSDFEKISSASARIADAKLFIDDRASLSITEMRSKCRRIKREHGLSLVVVDYITLMGGQAESETLRISKISRELKLLARDLCVPLIAISQLNRAVEQRNDKRPSMADLRQSGAIEQDADLIWFIYRDEIYNKDSAAKGMADLIISKHRNGALGTVNLSFNPRQCKFATYSGAPINYAKQENRWQGKSLDY